MAEPDVLTRAELASRLMNSYFRDLIAQRRHDPTDDLIGALIQLRDEGDRLSEDELVATIVLLFAAGFETTTNLIGNGLVTLLRNPDQIASPSRRSEPRPAAVEEMLRFESRCSSTPAPRWSRPRSPGTRIPAGQVVLTLLGAANRDPARSPTLTASTSPAPTSNTSASPPASTTASARRWPASRAPSFSNGFWPASSTSTVTRTLRGGRASHCAASRSCRW